MPLPGEHTTRASTSTAGASQTRALAGQVYGRTAGRIEQTLGVVDRALVALAETPGRKSVVLVTGGLVRNARTSSYRRVVTDSLRANAAIYSLDARGIVALTSSLSAEVTEPLRTQDVSMGAGLTEGRERSEGSESLALDTGGVVLKQNDLAGGLARIAADSRSYYLLGYAPSSRPADGRFHAIGVKVAREGVSVRARRGYWSPGRDEKAPKADARDAGIQRALDAPFDLPDVPVRALAQVLDASGSGRSRGPADRRGRHPGLRLRRARSDLA